MMLEDTYIVCYYQDRFNRRAI